jgi:ferredoxin
MLNLIYFSPTKTTKKIVHSIAEGIGTKVNKTYDLTLSDQRCETLEFGSDEMVIIGVPVYAGRVPEFLSETLENIKGNNTAAVFIALYGNREYEDALLELKIIGESKGFYTIAAGAFIGEHSCTSNVATGRPDAEDLKRARNFGEQIKEKIENAKAVNTAATFDVIVKGNFPYRERGSKTVFGPSTEENCTNCGICSQKCPMDAISISDVTFVDEEKCIRCCSCVKNCPVNAKQFHQEGFKKLVNMLESNLANIRKEPEIFI